MGKEMSELGGMRRVHYLALVPLGYDARDKNLSRVKVDRVVLHEGDKDIVVARSEVVTVLWESAPGSGFYPDHVSTDTGRWIPKKFIIQDPSPDRLLLLRVSPKEEEKE